MNKNLVIAAATERKPKLDALNDTMERLSTLMGKPKVTIVNRSIKTGVRETPLELQEITEGARNRVNSLKKELDSENIFADYYVGMEGGLFRIFLGNSNMAFLQSWAAVSDGTDIFFGSSPGISIPKLLQHHVFDEKKSLSDSIDSFAALHDVRSNEGTFGILTDGLISRRNSFEIALITAFAPFYNRNIYEQ